MTKQEIHTYIRRPYMSIRKRIWSAAMAPKNSYE